MTPETTPIWIVWKKILRNGGIQYSLQTEAEPAIGPYQINVAEEDIPQAEKLLSQAFD